MDEGRSKINVIIVVLVISIIIVLGILYSLIFPFSGGKLDVKYEVRIDNPEEKNYSVSVPTLILGNRYYNTPEQGYLEPIVEVDDYEVEEGEAKMDYTRTHDATLLQINSSADKLSIHLTKNKFDRDKYSEYKGEEGGGTMLYPFLNSYYNSNMSTGNYGRHRDEIGIVYKGESPVKITLNFEMIEEEGDQYTLHDGFTVEEQGFQLKDIIIEFKEPPP